MHNIISNKNQKMYILIAVFSFTNIKIIELMILLQTPTTLNSYI